MIAGQPSDDGFIEGAGDRVRRALGQGVQGRGTWALYGLFAGQCGWASECLDALARAASSAAGDLVDEGLFGVLLLLLYRRSGRQYDPYLRAARHLASAAMVGGAVPSDAAQVLVWKVFLRCMARDVGAQPECATYYRARAQALGVPQAAGPAPAWFVLAHGGSARLTKSQWRKFFNNEVLAQPDAATRFAASYCALHLVQDHRMLGRVGDVPVLTARDHVWLALEERLLKTREARWNPLMVGEGTGGPAVLLRGVSVCGGAMAIATMSVLVVLVAVLIWFRVAKQRRESIN